MSNIKNDNYKLLYDLEVSLKDSVEITKIKEWENHLSCQILCSKQCFIMIIA